MSATQPALERLRRPGRAGLAIGFALLAAGAVAAWAFGQRVAADRAAREAFPLVAGQLRVEGLVAPLQIDRDARGIPHVLASSEVDAWFGLGFAHAQDRLAQMLWLRRIALGRTAERIGEDGVATDRLVRTLGFPVLADAAVSQLEPETAALLEAYTAGVNARMARVRSGRVAPSLALRDARPLVPFPAGDETRSPSLDEDPWRVVDSLAVSKLVAWGAGASHERAVVLADLIERLGSMGARPFFPGGEQELGLSVPLDDPDERSGEEGPGQRPVTLLDLVALRAAAWAVPGRLTSSGAPFLVAELSVRPTVPSLLYEAHVRGGSLDAAGVTIPGLPVFWAGRNGEMSWAVAPLPVAAVDLFKESLRRGEAPPGEEGAVRAASTGSEETRGIVLYQNGSRWVPVAERTEEIRVGPPGATGSRVEQLRVRETRHGPIVNSVLADGSPRAPLALAWTGARSGDPLAGMARLAHAGSADDLREALVRHQAPPVEVVYADRGGEVGLQVAGWLPQRTLPSGLSPVPGRLRAFDWRSGIDPAALPHVELPVTGGGNEALADEVVSTGTRLEEELSGVRIEWLWRSGARARRIRSRLSALVGAGALELRAAAAIQQDVAANADPQLVPALLRLAGGRPELSPEGEEVANLLRGWDGVADVRSRGAVAFQLLVGHLLNELLEPAIGPELMDRYLALPGVEPTVLVQNIVLAAARGGRRGGWTDPERVGEAVRESLRRTWMSLSYRLGHNRERWTWGRLHEIEFRPFERPEQGAAGLPRSLGPFPMAGQALSIARAVPDPVSFQSRLASSFRMAVDLASPDRMLTSLAPGQSEHPRHVHFDDGVEPWREGREALVVTSRFLLEEAAVERLLLEPSR